MVDGWKVGKGEKRKLENTGYTNYMNGTNFNEMVEVLNCEKVEELMWKVLKKSSDILSLAP